MAKRKGYIIADQYAAYFVTFTVVGWMDVFTRKECKHIIIDALKYCQKNKGLIINAWVLMGNHMHLVISAKKDSDGVSAIIRDFKKFTARKLIEWITQSKTESRKEWMKKILRSGAVGKKNYDTHQFWKPDNMPKVMLYPNFMAQKINYIHKNPVVSEIVSQPDDYIYSSARNYVGRNDYLIDVEVIDVI